MKIKIVVAIVIIVAVVSAIIYVGFSSSNIRRIHNNPGYSSKTEQKFRKFILNGA